MVDGERENWYNDVDGVLAVVILLQYFTKCMYRNDDRCYRFDEESIEMVRCIIGKEDYLKLYSDYHLLTVVSPLAYSEDEFDNLKAIELVEARVQKLTDEGGNVPRYKAFISLM